MEPNMKKILLVDNDQTLQTMLTQYLTKHGYSLHAVTSGVQELKLLAQEPPDLVIADIVMPRMDSFEFCFRLRATRPGQLIPLIFLTATEDIEDRIQGHGVGANDYITKPFKPLELLVKIEVQIERSRRSHQMIVRHNEKPPASVDRLQDVEPKEDLLLLLIPDEALVFWEVVQGSTNKQISQLLFLTPRTVQTHLSNILTKLNLENRSQLVRFAFNHGYRPPPTHDE
jgi:DNA-binding NarL/FixJ family response regulator